MDSQANTNGGSREEYDVIDANPVNGSTNDETDVRTFENDAADVRQIEFDGFENEEVIARMPTDKDSPFYNMGHQERGIAQIFVQGSEFYTNAEDLANCLKDLGFSVFLNKNLDRHGIETTLEELSKKDHNNSDCLVIIVVTYTREGKLKANDSYYDPDILWSYFEPKQCSSLSGKPKMFFIQASQRTVFHRPAFQMIKHILNSETDGDFGVKLYRIPQLADFLIVFSPIDGSLFLQSLGKELKENGRKEDLMILLTHINTDIAMDIKKKMFLHNQNKIPCIRSTLTRGLQFTDKKNFNYD